MELYANGEQISLTRHLQKVGGSIWAEGAIGKGATFFFSLPKAVR